MRHPQARLPGADFSKLMKIYRIIILQHVESDLPPQHHSRPGVIHKHFKSFVPVPYIGTFPGPLNRQTLLHSCLQFPFYTFHTLPIFHSLAPPGISSISCAIPRLSLGIISPLSSPEYRFLPIRHLHAPSYGTLFASRPFCCSAFVLANRRP
jgi:hypothetical protein